MPIRVDNALNFLNCFAADLDDFLSRLVTADGKRIYQTTQKANSALIRLPKCSSKPINFRAERSVKEVLASDFLEANKTVTIRSVNILLHQYNNYLNESL